MNWKLLDLIPVMRDSGPHITRSASGRVGGELAAWLPSVLLGRGVSWNDAGVANTRVRVEIFNEHAEIELEIGSSGGLKTLKMSRCGNPNGGDYRYGDFGVIVKKERRFNGFTIPGRIRAGWLCGSELFESEGELFRASTDDAQYKWLSSVANLT